MNTNNSQSKIFNKKGVEGYEKKENLERNEANRKHASWTCTWGSSELEKTPGRI